MYEVSFANEPMDYRLLGLRILKKIWIPVAAAVLGALLVWGIHYGYRIITLGGRTYQAESMYYIEYAENAGGQEELWVNRYTWADIIEEDMFVDYMYERFSDEYTREEIKSVMTATIDSDVRYLFTRCTTHDPDLSIRMEKELENVMLTFKDQFKDIVSMEVVTECTTAEDTSNIRSTNALILGAVLGLIISLIIMCAVYTADTSVYVPATLEKRYHIKSLGAASMPEFKENCKVILEGLKEVSLVSLSKDSVSEAGISLDGLEVRRYTNPVYSTDVTEALKNSEGGIVIAVDAGKRNGKQTERLLEYLNRLDIKVTSIMLVNEDEKFINSYYRR